ncbi:2-dehydropantoate 2-reductase [Halalkalibacter kiskunsagensis]|uniref:2-dehydropantoate 2-reductase n=1 Tax=Halalkalibacter kiskunsagensis TaxID=1548599 RepID=A0ABV6KM35_9BACI
MKIVIVGPGSIGLLVTFYLAHQHHMVSLVTNRQEQTTVINEKGIHLIRHKQIAKMNVPVTTFSNFNWDETIDLLIVTVKSYQVTNVLKKVDFTNVKSILFLQNGMGHTEIFSKLAIPELAVGVIEHGALRENDFTVHHTGVGKLRWSYVREGSGIINEVLKGIIDPNFPVEKEQDWTNMLESKLIVNACINPITALFQVENGELVKNEHYLSMMNLVFKEVISVVGFVDDSDTWEYVCQVCRKTAHNRSSMLVDIVNNRKTEIDSIVGYLIRRARDQQIDIPILTFLYEGVRAKELKQGRDAYD